MKLLDRKNPYNQLMPFHWPRHMLLQVLLNPFKYVPYLIIITTISFWNILYIMKEMYVRLTHLFILLFYFYSWDKDRDQSYIHPFQIIMIIFQPLLKIQNPTIMMNANRFFYP